MSESIDIHSAFRAAAQRWYHMDRDQFKDEWLPGRDPEYVAEKYLLFRANPFRYFGALDEDNQTRFVLWFFLGEPVSAHPA